MINPKKIEQIARQIHKFIPKVIREFSEDNIEEKICQVIQTQLTHLNLVSREELDTHIQVLLRTREKLEQLEQRLIKLENNYMLKEVNPTPIVSQVDD